MPRSSRPRKSHTAHEQAVIKEAYQDLVHYSNACHRMLAGLSAHLSDNSKGPSFMERLIDKEPALGGELAIILATYMDLGMKLAAAHEAQDRKLMVKFSGDKSHVN